MAGTPPLRNQERTANAAVKRCVYKTAHTSTQREIIAMALKKFFAKFPQRPRLPRPRNETLVSADARKMLFVVVGLREKLS